MHLKNSEYYLALSAVLFWSTVATAFKIALQEMGYLELLLTATGTSLLVLFIYIIATHRLYKLYKIKLRDYIRFAGLGFLNPFLYYILLFNAYTRLQAQEALVLNYTWAVMVVLLSIPILKQKIGFRGIISVFISFLGVIIIAFKGDFSEVKFSDPWGIIIALTSAVIWALYWLYSMKLQFDKVIILFLNFSFGFIYVFIAYSLFSNPQPFGISGIGAAVYIGIFEMGITFVLWLKALSLARNTSTVANLIFLSPFLSLAFIHLFLGENIMPSTIFGLIFVIFGIIFNKMNKLRFIKEND